jgi:hypothetical protein
MDGGLDRTIGSDVMKYCEKAGTEPDWALLQRVGRALGGNGDEKGKDGATV